MLTERQQVFVVHHNPNSGRYRYGTDPNDAIASAKALVAEGEGTWVAGSCRRMIGEGDLLLFKFGGARLRQEVGVYAAARVTHAPALMRGRWRLSYATVPGLSRRLMRSPILGRDLARLVPRSYGASIQAVSPKARALLETLLVYGASSPANAASERTITHGLLILQEPLDKILAGTKTWEIRGKATARRGSIALIQSKSGHVIGTCDVIDVVGPLSLAELRRNARRTGLRPDTLPYATTYAWVLRDARRLPAPVPYRHPSGAVIWVRLERDVLRRVRRRAATAA